MKPVGEALRRFNKICHSEPAKNLIVLGTFIGMGMKDSGA